MERESFADAGTAELMNEHFVNVKVDREERPELDEIYMAATQIYTHQGGWPNSLFLTPDLKPYFAGTYFPPADRYGRPSFRTVLLSMKEAWDKRRDEVYEQAEELAQAMRGFLEERGRPAAAVASAGGGRRPRRRASKARFDGVNTAASAGRPNSRRRRTSSCCSSWPARIAEAGRQLGRTLDAMARGGIYDQLAGGFHRYATDAAWKVPHFEKMLYDNGLLLEVYARDYARTGDPERARIVAETARFLARELTSPAGALWSAIDAETDGMEGGYHAFTRPRARGDAGARRTRLSWRRFSASRASLSSITTITCCTCRFPTPSRPRGAGVSAARSCWRLVAPFKAQVCWRRASGARSRWWTTRC